MGSAPGKKRTGGDSKTKKRNKQRTRAGFESRHIDQVWEDVRKPGGVHDGKSGPLGTTAKVELDEDLPAMGKFYCTPCSRYFINGVALADHERTKAHKKRIKILMAARPHNAVDAEVASGMGKPDNGQPLRAATMDM